VIYGRAIRLMAFFEGALSYKDVKSMPLGELFRLEQEAGEISDERDAAIERTRNGK